MRINRLGDGPIIAASLSETIGTNIQGPSLIAAPPWLDQPLGLYYLYFADHKGAHIRLAYADVLTGPWTIYEPGALQLADSCFLTEPPPATQEQLELLHQRYRLHFGDYTIEQVMEDALTPHIASPDVHVDLENQQVVMYFHGLDRLGVQSTRVATSTDGVQFVARPTVLGASYFRVFEYKNWWYALQMPGLIRRSRTRFDRFESGPQLFQPEMRHSAVRRRGDRLDVFWTRAGDAPESILHSHIDLSADWMHWTEIETQPVMQPELSWEGSDEPVEPSRRGAVNHRVQQLRDPAVFVEDGRTYLLYSAAGESCIGLAEVIDE